MRSPIEPGRGGAGFVLLEAVVALVILSLFGLALLSAVSAQVRTADKANTLLVARFLADDRLTALQLLDHEGLARLPDSRPAASRRRWRPTRGR
jgi:type II secretory pathway pseudopilin PulG